MIYEYYQLLWDRAGDRLKVRDFAEAQTKALREGTPIFVYLTKTH